MIVAFRRPASKEKTITVKLSGLTAGQTYTVLNSDTGETVSKTGSELSSGFVLALDEPRGSLLLKYKPAE